jgi:hypothetical protein
VPESAKKMPHHANRAATNSPFRPVDCTKMCSQNFQLGQVHLFGFAKKLRVDGGFTAVFTCKSVVVLPVMAGLGRGQILGPAPVHFFYFSGWVADIVRIKGNGTAFATVNRHCFLWKGDVLGLA